MKFGTDVRQVVSVLTHIVRGGSLPRVMNVICIGFLYDPHCLQGGLDYPYLSATGLKIYIFTFIFLNDDY